MVSIGPAKERLRLRPAAQADAEAIRALVFGVLSEYGLSCDPAGTDADLYDIEQVYVARGGAFDVLVTADGVVAGSVGLYPVDDTVCELRKMYLLGAYRGQGWGKRLLDHALDQARARGFRRVTLETASVLHEAIALYRRYGFTPYTPAHLAQRCDQAFFLEL